MVLKDLVINFIKNNLFSIGILIILGCLFINLFKEWFIKKGINSLIFLLTFTICLLVADTLLRVVLKSKLYYRPHERFGNVMPEYPQLLARYDKLIEYTGTTYGDLVAGSGQIRYKELRRIKFVTDSLGFRNSINQKNKKNELIILGDSFGVGNGTHQDSTFTGLLNQSHEVYNLSYPGNPLQELANLIVTYDKINLTDQPIIVWFLFTGNDLPHSIPTTSQYILDLIAENNLHKIKLTNSFFLGIEKLKSFIRRSPIRQLLTRIKRKEDKGIVVSNFIDGQKMLFFKNYIEAAFISKKEIHEQKGYPSYEKIFSEAAQFAQNKNAILKVILLPTKYEVYNWSYKKTLPWSIDAKPSGFSEALTYKFNKLNVEFIDAKPFLIDCAKKQLDRNGKALWWLDDTHLNNEGHQAVEKLIQTNLLKTTKN